MIHVHAVVVRNIKSAAANEYNAPRPCQILVALFLPAKKVYDWLGADALWGQIEAAILNPEQETPVCNL